MLRISFRALTSTCWPLAVAIAALLYAASESVATPERTYGLKNAGEAGKGVKIEGADKARLDAALALLEPLIITIKGGKHYDGLDIAKDIRKMHREARLGKGVGATWNDKNKIAGGTFKPKPTTGTPPGSADAATMNLSAQLFTAKVDIREMACTIAHERTHARQDWTTLSEKEKEAEAHQVSMETWLLLGGAVTDPYYKLHERAVAENKPPVRRLHSAIAPDDGARVCGSRCGHEYILLQSPGQLYFLENGVAVDSVGALPDQSWFDLVTYELPGVCERILLFGSDLTDPDSPTGTLTVVDADSVGFVFRRDSTLASLKIPYSVSRDGSATGLLVLDAHFDGDGVVSMNDTDGDSIPDVQSAAAFAPRGFATVDSTLSVRWDAHPAFGEGLTLRASDSRVVDVIDLTDTLAFATDANEDGVADAWHPVLHGDFVQFAPLFCDPPLPGTSVVQLAGMTGHTVQMVKTDSTGLPTTEDLGSTLIVQAGVPQGLELSRALIDSEYVALIDLTDSIQVAAPTQCLLPTAAVWTTPPRVLASQLGTSRPNPFRTSAARVEIPFELYREAHVRLRLYDVSGRTVRSLFEGMLGPGAHMTQWDGRDERGHPVKAGMYFYRLDDGGRLQTRALVRLP